MASGAAIARAYTARTGHEIAGAQTVFAILDTDADARAVVADAIDALAEGLVGVIHAACPELIVLGGGLSRAGAVLTAIVVAYIPLRRHAGAAMLWCVAGFGVFTVVFGLSHSMPVALLSLVLVGACDMVSVIVRHTIVQLWTPDDMRGRVSAVNMVFIGASNEVGQFESGVTAGWWGAVPAVLVGGMATIAVALLWIRLFPVLAQTETLEEPNGVRAA